MDAPLNSRLSAYTDKLRELNFPFAEAYDELVARLYAGEVGRDAPSVGETMPSFLLPDRSGTLVALSELTAEGSIVLSINRGHWCPFCKIELKTLAEHHLEIERAGAQIVTIIPDCQRFTDDLRSLTKNKITILTDIDNGYALSIGLVAWVGETLKMLMKGRGFHLDVFQGNDGWFLPVPATFVIDRKFRIRARFVDSDFRKRMEISEIVAALD
jgi:peroxiredoxin